MTKDIQVIDEYLGNVLIYKNKCQACEGYFNTNKENQYICGDCVPQRLTSK